MMTGGYNVPQSTVSLATQEQDFTQMLGNTRYSNPCIFSVCMEWIAISGQFQFVSMINGLPLRSGWLTVGHVSTLRKVKKTGKRWLSFGLGGQECGCPFLCLAPLR